MIVELNSERDWNKTCHMTCWWPREFLLHALSEENSLWIVFEPLYSSCSMMLTGCFFHVLLCCKRILIIKFLSQLFVLRFSGGHTECRDPLFNSSLLCIAFVGLCASRAFNFYSRWSSRFVWCKGHFEIVWDPEMGLALCITLEC